MNKASEHAKDNNSNGHGRHDEDVHIIEIAFILASVEMQNR